MGASCCAEDRHVANDPHLKGDHKHALAFNPPGLSPQKLTMDPNSLTEDGFEQLKKPAHTPKIETEGEEGNNSVIDFYWCAADSFPISWEKEMIASQQTPIPIGDIEEADKPLPFLICGFSDNNENLALICSKPYPKLYKTIIDTKKLLQRCVRKKFIGRSMEESVFREEVANFLK